MRKIILGLAVVAMAAATSAYTNTTNEKNVEAANFFYKQNMAGTEYIKVTEEPNENSDCLSGPQNSCYIGYDSYPGSDTLDPENLPSEPEVRSSSNGYIL